MLTKRPCSKSIPRDRTPTSVFRSLLWDARLFFVVLESSKNLIIQNSLVIDQADLLVKQHSAASGSSNGAGDKFELLARQLRFICLECAIYTEFLSTSQLER
jgi:hypothetical protein